MLFSRVSNTLDNLSEKGNTYQNWNIFFTNATFLTGYKAVRDKQLGSWFINEFVLSAELYAHTHHLIDIVVKVGNSLIFDHLRHGLIPIDIINIYVVVLVTATVAYFQQAVYSK